MTSVAVPAATAAPAEASPAAATATTKSVIQDPSRVAGVAIGAGVSPEVVSQLLADPEATIAAGERLGVPRDTAIWVANNPEQALGAAQSAGIAPVWAANTLAANL